MMNTKQIILDNKKKALLKSIGFLLIILTLGSWLTSCNKPTGIQQSVDQGAVQTAVQQTVMAQNVITELTKAAAQIQQPEEPQPPTATETPVYTVTPSLTAPPTNTAG